MVRCVVFERIETDWSRPCRSHGLRPAGQGDDTIALLEGALPRLGESSEGMYYVALESLAAARQKAGDTARAIETLDVTRGMRTRAAYGASYRPLLWLRLQAQLAGLYRQVGRDADADALDLEIATLLSVADPDHALRPP